MPPVPAQLEKRDNFRLKALQVLVFDPIESTVDGPASEKELDGLRMATIRSRNEGRASILVCSVDICSLTEEKLEYFNVSIIGSNVNRLPTTDIYMHVR